jgi:hypothetical protein
MPTFQQQLRDLGLPPEQAAAIERDVDQGDGRALLHELLLRGLWSDVVDEGQPHPKWIADWLQLGASGFPIINAQALERLLQAGADPHDLTDVVRSAQVLTLYNIGQLLDHPTRELGYDISDKALVRLGCIGDDTTRHLPLRDLHSSLLERDPSGRHGEPRSLELRQLAALPDEVQAQLETYLRDGKASLAAALWKKHVGGDLKSCLSAVQRLRDQLPASTTSL